MATRSILEIVDHVPRICSGCQHRQNVLDRRGKYHVVFDDHDRRCFFGGQRPDMPVRQKACYVFLAYRTGPVIRGPLAKGVVQSCGINGVDEMHIKPETPGLGFLHCPPFGRDGHVDHINFQSIRLITPKISRVIMQRKEHVIRIGHYSSGATRPSPRR